MAYALRKPCFVLGSDLAMASVSPCHMSKTFVLYGFCVFALRLEHENRPSDKPDLEFILALKLALGLKQAMPDF